MKSEKWVDRLVDPGGSLLLDLKYLPCFQAASQSNRTHFLKST